MELFVSLVRGLCDCATEYVVCLCYSKEKEKPLMWTCWCVWGSAFEPMNGLPLWVEVVLSPKKMEFILKYILGISLAHGEFHNDLHSPLFYIIRF